MMNESGCEATVLVRLKIPIFFFPPGDWPSSNHSVQQCILPKKPLNRKFAKNEEKSHQKTYRGADKSLARPGRKQATATKL